MPRMFCCEWSQEWYAQRLQSPSATYLRLAAALHPPTRSVKVFTHRC